MRTLSKMALRHPGSRPARLIHKAFRHASFIETHTWPDLLSASGASTVFCLSFDCDTKEDAIALPKLTDALRRYEIPASFALIGELVEEAPDAYGRLVEAGYEIVNHGYSYHTAQRPDGTCYSSMFYHQLTAEQIHDQGDFPSSPVRRVSVSGRQVVVCAVHELRGSCRKGGVKVPLANVAAHRHG